MKRLVALAFFVSFVASSTAEAKHRIIVLCPKVKRDQCNAAVAKVDTFATEAFNIRVGPKGNPSIVTHYALEWQISKRDWDQLVLELTAVLGSAPRVIERDDADPALASPTFLGAIDGQGLARHPDGM